MRSKIIICIFLFVAVIANAQNKVIQLYPGAAPGSENWNWQEKENDSNMIHTKIVYNVVQPTLTVFPPDEGTANGTAVVICPGGGFHILSINSEGNDVAKWLNKKGVTAFVLRYRLLHSVSDDPVKELMSTLGGDRTKFNESVAPVVALATVDTKTAMAYVRQHAADYGISPKRIGLIGFSAGGTLTEAVAFDYTPDTRPDFVAPIYAYVPDAQKKDVPKDAPPMFIAAASDDQLGLVPSSLELYTKWQAAGKPVEMHLYTKGGHGFGLRQQRLTSDTWIDRFGDWLNQLGLLVPEGLTPQQLAAYKRVQEDRLPGRDWPNLKRFADDDKNLAMAASKEHRVVFMGNSITEGWGRLDPDFFAGKPYVNRGISGQTTPQMLLRFRQDVINLKPAVVVILAGTNDIAGNTGPATLEQIIANIISMCELAKANKIHVVLSSILPAFDYPWRPGQEPAEKIVTLNSMVKDYAAKNGFVYLDYFSAMVDARKGLPKELSGDGVHPNLAGYKIMEPLVEKAIAQALK